jgi:DNA-binding NarL/FixJ family response regulator
MNESYRNGSRPVRICLLMPDSIFAQGLLSLLTRSRNFDCVVLGPLEAGQELPSSAEWRKIDLFLLQYDQVKHNGFLPGLRHRYPQAKLIGFVSDEKSLNQQTSRRSGMDVLLGTHIGQEELFQYLQQVWGGRLSPTAPSGRNPQERLVNRYQLTPRELEILQLLAQALSTKEIAQHLFISAQTVSVHRKHILRKLGVNNTAGAVRVAMEHNLHRENF